MTAIPFALDFQPETHTYSVGGEVYPSVTQILATAGLVDWTYCSDWARERGSLVHRAIHLDLTTGLDWSSVSEEFHPFIAAARQVLEDLHATTLEVERRVLSVAYRYAGTLDWLGEIDGKIVLLDWKTGPTVPAYALQTAAYADAYFEETSRRVAARYAVTLKRDGSYQVHTFTDRRDGVRFRAAAVVAGLRKEYGLA